MLLASYGLLTFLATIDLVVHKLSTVDHPQPGAPIPWTTVTENNHTQGDNLTTMLYRALGTLQANFRGANPQPCFFRVPDNLQAIKPTPSSLPKLHSTKP